jgi:hypothetical protein
MDRSEKTIMGVILTLLAACCCLAVIFMSLGGFVVYRSVSEFSTQVGPVVTSMFAPDTPTPAPNIVLTPVPSPVPGAGDTLEILENAVIPPSDLRELAMRLQGIPDIPEVVNDIPTDYEWGDELEFNVSNTDTDENFTVTARLVYKTENVYFFAETGVSVDEEDVRRLVDNFQDETYPTNREFFGSEWNPGVDGDPRLYILYARGLGFSVAGYYSSADEYSRLAHEFSNEKEMFYINADTTGPGDSSLPGTLAHEFQHMIHWYHDRNEETWMNEGSSVMAEFLNGYSADGFDSIFISEPDVQLNSWVEAGGDPGSISHYGAAFLFMTYFLDRFGHEATQALVAHEANGLRAVDEVLTARGLNDPATGRPLTAVEVFADWVITNYVGDADIGDGRYDYHNYADAPVVFAPTDTFDDCPVERSATVHQYAADYYEINCSGSWTINFTGSQQVSVIPADPHGGRYAFWSHRNDESDTTLTREFDLTGLSSATFTYWAWWAIEVDYDYAYLEVSTDGGETWQMIETPSGTDDDPTGNNLGWGYTGNSGGGNTAEWVQETVDLSKYAGQEILLRFEYVTDAAVNRAGFMVDDLSIPELDYATGFEEADAGWEAEGFVRIDNLLPQSFVVQVIVYDDVTRVERMALTDANVGTFPVDLGPGEKAVLVVSGITPFTTEVASYRFEIR